VALALPATRGRSPYEVILGPAFASLHPHVQRAHLAPLRAAGTIDVEHGSGWLTAPLIRSMTLPAAGLSQPVQLDVVVAGSECVWTRRIGDAILRTRQRADGSRLVERSGLGRVTFDLAVEDGALVYRKASIHFASLPVPSFVRPSVGAIVSPTAGGWHVAVTVTWRGAILCRYCGDIHTS